MKKGLIQILVRQIPIADKLGYSTAHSVRILQIVHQARQTRFTSALHSDENGDLFLVQDPDEQRFVGAPIEEVDQNWESLISG